MAFQNLHAEVEELFAEAQGEVSSAFDLLVIDAQGGGPVISGFHVVNTAPRLGRVKSPARKAYMKPYAKSRALEDIERRLLAGERPKLGGPGRPPTRWFAVAKALGIDLHAPVPAPGQTSVAA